MATDPETTKATLGAAAQLTKDVYADVAQPAARRVGSALDTVFKIGLSPFAMLDAGFERSKVWLEEKINARMADTPSNCRISPPNNIAVPALTRIAMSSDAPGLRDLYAELLLKAMDSRTVSTVHPAYMLLIEQMTAEEAFVFVSLMEDKYGVIFSDRDSTRTFDREGKSVQEQFRALCDSLHLPGAVRSQIWLDNLVRLGLIAIERYTEAELVQPERHSGQGLSVETDQSQYMVFTAFGKAFREACASPKDTVQE